MAAAPLTSCRLPRLVTVNLRRRRWARRGRRDRDLLHHVVGAWQMILPNFVGMILMSLRSLLQGVFDAIEGCKHSLMFRIIFRVDQIVLAYMEEAFPVGRRWFRVVRKTLVEVIGLPVAQNLFEFWNAPETREHFYVKRSFSDLWSKRWLICRPCCITLSRK